MGGLNTLWWHGIMFVHLLRWVDCGSGGLCISIKLCWGNGFGGLVTKSLTFGFGDRLLPPNMGRTGGWSTKVSRGGHGHGCDLWHSI